MKRANDGSTHWDIADAGVVCHDECAVAQIKGAALAMRERAAQACEAIYGPWDANNSPEQSVAVVRDACAAAIRALEV